MLLKKASECRQRIHMPQYIYLTIRPFPARTVQSRSDTSSEFSKPKSKSKQESEKGLKIFQKNFLKTVSNERSYA